MPSIATPLHPPYTHPLPSTASYPRLTPSHPTPYFTQMLPAADASNFMKAYAAFNGTNTEADVIKYASALLSRTDVQAFFALPDSFDKGGLDADLVLCTVLVEATPAGLATFAAKGKAQEATVDSLLANTMLMRDMLVAGSATNGHKGVGAGTARAYV